MDMTTIKITNFGFCKAVGILCISRVGHFMSKGLSQAITAGLLIYIIR
jgi:hypothetical protein